MTELDATILAEQDAAQVHAKVEVGALPKDIGRLVVMTLVARVDGFEVDEASDIARKAAKEQLVAPTFAEHLLTRCSAVVRSSIRHMVPEDTRALIVWLVGRGAGDFGFLHPVIEILGESAGPGKLQQLQAELTAITTRMDQADLKLFSERVKVLNRTRRDIIRGLRMDAHWAMNEGDGVAARGFIVQARDLALTWLKQQERAEQAGFEPWPQPYW